MKNTRGTYRVDSKEGRVLYEKFEHFKSNLRVLALAEKENLSNEFIIGGIIDKFFIQFELGWKVLKELLSYEGQSISASGSPKMILKTAFTIMILSMKIFGWGC